MKQTEIGEIPEDWNLYSLKEITNLIIDGTHFTPTYLKYGVPFLRVTDIQGKLNYANFKFISSIEHKHLTQRCKPEYGDLLLSKNGTIGIPKTVDWRWEFSIFVSLALIRPKKQKLEVNFLEQFFKSNFLKTQLKERAKQGTVTNLHLEEIREIIIPLPPKSEQTAIATVLSDMDKLIHAIEQLIHKKQQIKTATMQNLLTGKVRLDEFDTHATKKSELGEIPSNWEAVKLGDITKIKTGSRNNQDKISEGKYPFFVRSATVERINSFSYDCEAVLIPGEGGIGSIFHYINGKFDAHQRVYVIRDFINCHAKFIYYAMVQSFGKHAMENSVKATVDSLRLPTFLNFEFVLPKNVKEQTAIAQILTDIDKEITQLTQRLEKLKNIKQGAMQSLLTGKIRLPTHLME